MRLISAGSKVRILSGPPFHFRFQETLLLRSCFETPPLPTLRRRYPCDFTFYVAHPIRSIPDSILLFRAKTDPIKSPNNAPTASIMTSRMDAVRDATND